MLRQVLSSLTDILSLIATRTSTDPIPVGSKCSKNCTCENLAQPQSGTFKCLGTSNSQPPYDGTYDVTPEKFYTSQLHVK